MWQRYRIPLLVLALCLAILSNAHPGGHGSMAKRQESTLARKRCSTGKILCNNECVDSNTNTNCGWCNNKVHHVP